MNRDGYMPTAGALADDRTDELLKLLKTLMYDDEPVQRLMQCDRIGIMQGRLNQKLIGRPI